MEPELARRTAPEGPLPRLLAELERVLGDEALALKKLDREAIERATEAKLELCDAIARTGARAGAESRDALERLRRLALRNQMLLAHARDSVRQVLGIASGQTASPALGGLRVNVRG